MAITKPASLLFAANTNVAAGTTRASPVVGNTIDYTGAQGGELHITVTNGASAPAVGCTVEVQASPDGTLWTYYDQVTGDTTASSVSSATIPVDKGVAYIRLIAYGNTTNAVTVNGKATVIPG